MTPQPSSPGTSVPCPFCKKPPGTKVGPPAMARCITPGCEGKDLAAVTLVEWNANAQVSPGTTDTLIHGWRKEAVRFRRAQQECDIGDDEWFLNKTEAERLERCAYELEQVLR
jgi:hypothetical protein